MKIKPSTYRKIDLKSINKTENVRQDYGDISELAGSIESIGQLEAVGVIEKDDGTFDPVYGFRRIAAFQFLVDAGKDYNQIEAKIITGDPLIIQMAENESRKQLTAEEFENGLAKMIEAGIKPKEIAKLLSIRITRISDALAARKTRLKLEEQGIDTAGMSTSAVSALRNVPDEEAPSIIEQVKKKGGTVKAVKEIKEEKRKKDNPSMFVAKEPEIIEEKKEDNIENQKGNINFISSNLNENNKKIEVTGGIVDEVNNFSFIPVILESPYMALRKTEYPETMPPSLDIQKMNENIEYACNCALDCINRKESPFASHLFYSQFLVNEVLQRKKGMQAGQAWYAHAVKIVVYTDYGITPGMQEGIDFFKSIKPDAEIEERKLYKENENGK